MTFNEDVRLIITNQIIEFAHKLEKDFNEAGITNFPSEEIVMVMPVNLITKRVVLHKQEKEISDNPIVFISYSWDSESHKKWIRSFANKLMANGIEVILDQYELGLGKSLNHFVEKSIAKANKILIIFTQNYRLKADQRKGGVGYEYSIINNELYRDQIYNDKFIPILKAGSVQDSIPSFMQQYIFLDLANERVFDKQFDELLRVIYNKPMFKKPHIGEKPKFE